MFLDDRMAICNEVKTGWLTPALLTALDHVDDRALATTVTPVTNTLRALKFFQPHQTRLVILGQDPYHTPGKANGLAFGVSPTFKWRGRDSLQNVLDEADSRDMSLETWASQGVLLLNGVLTVEKGLALSHAHLGWQRAVTAILREVPRHAVFLLWGRFSQELYRLAGLDQESIFTSHPSPFSAHVGARPFVGSGCFKRANGLLQAAGQPPINWRLRKEVEHADER